MSESPAQIGALKLISNKDVFLVWADDGESIRAFSIRAGLFRGKALRGVSLSIEEVAESTAQFGAVLNIGHAISDRQWEFREPGHSFSVTADDSCFKLPPEGQKRIVTSRETASRNG